MEIQFAAAKTGKYASSESGDTLEMIERPHGGISFVLVDGQRSGKSAKNISNVVARKAIQLLSEGVRDGAAARAAHDYLYAYRGGKVSATLNILSLDVATQTFVISRNSESPVLFFTSNGGFRKLDEPSMSVGTRRHTRPQISELPVEAGTVIVLFTDGLIHAGSLTGKGSFEPEGLLSNMIAEQASPQQMADRLVAEAVDRDDGRPRDDISVLVAAVREGQGDEVRRLQVRIPLQITWQK